MKLITSLSLDFVYNSRLQGKSSMALCKNMPLYYFGCHMAQANTHKNDDQHNTLLICYVLVLTQGLP